MKRPSIFAAMVLAASLTAVFTPPTHAEDVTVGALKISTPWTRATPKGASIGGGYVTITNTGSTSDTLIGGSSDISNHLEVHEMSMDKGVMKMRMMPKGLEIKPGDTVVLKPGGYHIMFMGLKQQLMQNQHIKATLQFDKAGKVAVDFAVAGVGAQTPAAAHGHDMPGMKMK